MQIVLLLLLRLLSAQWTRTHTEEPPQAHSCRLGGHTVATTTRTASTVPQNLFWRTHFEAEMVKRHSSVRKDGIRAAATEGHPVSSGTAADAAAAAASEGRARAFAERSIAPLDS
uniref:Putative secreted protein n=1 Tax=Anopheles darlingi TaxID=43151 RepID=A0A2M4D9T3_ANODA